MQLRLGIDIACRAPHQASLADERGEFIFTGRRFRTRTWSQQQDLGDLKARIDAAEEAWSAARSLHVPELSSFLVWVLQALYDLAGDDERSFEVAHRALEFVDLLPSAQRAEDLFSMSFTDLYAARYEDAERLSRQGYEPSHDMSAHARMHSTFILMSCAYYTGRWSELPPLIEEHIELYALEPGVTCTAVRGGPVMDRARGGGARSDRHRTRDFHRGAPCSCPAGAR
jgi:hypothetical protein